MNSMIQFQLTCLKICKYFNIKPLYPQYVEDISFSKEKECQIFECYDYSNIKFKEEFISLIDVEEYVYIDRYIQKIIPYGFLNYKIPIHLIPLYEYISILKLLGIEQGLKENSAFIQFQKNLKEVKNDIFNEWIENKDDNKFIYDYVINF